MLQKSCCKNLKCFEICCGKANKMQKLLLKKVFVLSSQKSNHCDICCGEANKQKKIVFSKINYKMYFFQLRNKTPIVPESTRMSAICLLKIS